MNLSFADGDNDVSNLHSIGVNVDGDIDVGSFGKDSNSSIGNTIIDKVRIVVKYIHAIAIIIVVGFLIKYVVDLTRGAGSQAPQALDLAKKGIVYSLIALFFLGSLYYWVNLSFYSGQNLKTSAETPTEASQNLD